MTQTTPASGDDRKPAEDSSTEKTTSQHQATTIRPPAGGRPGTGVTRNLYWLLPAFAFLLGVLLGGSVIAATDVGSSDDPVAVATPSPVPDDAAPGDRTVTVPASCADGLDRADAAVQAARDGIGAIGDLDTAALQRALDRLQTLQPEITDLAGKCRAAATD